MARPPQGLTPSPSVLQSSVNIGNQTLRQIVHVTIGGDRVRVVLSNVFGTEPLVVGAALVARHDQDALIQPQSARSLTFAGKPNTVVPPGALMLSDPVSMNVSPLSNLVVDMFLPGNTATSLSPATIHA